MQLVLAVHPDKRQTEQIAVLVRKRLDVEMVQAASAGEGLQELGDRIPDLILTAPLLSPFDEDVLAEYLRELGSAAAHVQTLRIPVLSTPSQSSSAIFSFGRKKRVESAPDGCDPQIFVDEMAVYLTRAAEDRRAAATAAASAAALDQAAPPLPTPDDRPVSAPESEAVDYSYRFDPYPSAEPGVTTASEYTPAYRQADAPPFESAFPVYQPDQNYAAAREPEPRESDPVPAPAPNADAASQIETAFPIYRSELVAESAVSDLAPSAPTSDEAFPIYRSEVIAEPAAAGVPTSEPTKDEVKDEPFPVYRREQSIFDASTHRIDPHRRSTSVSSVTPVYQPPPERIEPVTQADPLGLHVEDNLEAHASLLLDPPQAEHTNQPFVVHSANETVTLSESLERAAAQLEASGLCEPMPAREAERVPMHRLTSLDELPLPDVLSTRVTQSVAMGLSAPMPPTVDVDPSLLAEPAPPIAGERTPPVVVESAPEPVLIEPAPIVLEAAAPQAIVEPATPVATMHVEPAAAPPVVPEPIAPPPLAEASPKAADDRTANAAATRRPSFEAALAAIRKAWGRPRRPADSINAPVSLNISHAAARVEPVTPAALPQTPVVSAAASEEPTPVSALVEDNPSPLAAQESIVDTETKSEVDLTLDIDALEEHSAAVDQQGPVLLDPEAIDVVARQVDEDVYELSASPALHDLEADLAAAGPPPPVREVFPAAPQPAAPAARDNTAAVAPATRKRDKHRKKSDKNKPVKPRPAADRPATNDTQPAQDEWGLFDPNRCGFAALVDKLNEVTDEKDQKPAKTSVRVISYG